MIEDEPRPLGLIGQAGVKPYWRLDDEDRLSGPIFLAIFVLGVVLLFWEFT